MKKFWKTTRGGKQQQQQFVVWCLLAMKTAMSMLACEELVSLLAPRGSSFDLAPRLIVFIFFFIISKTGPVRPCHCIMDLTSQDVAHVKPEYYSCAPSHYCMLYLTSSQNERRSREQPHTYLRTYTIPDADLQSSLFTNAPRPQSSPQ